jgi:ribosomal protein L11 methyltransferase
MKDKYTELTVRVNETFVELVADYISSVSGESVEIGPDRVIVRSENPVETILEALKELDPSIGIEVEKKEKENIDWIQAYKDSVQPVEAGKFYIHPEWYPPKKGKINILINPALAFGSGHHATTFSCLEAIGDIVREGDRLLDVGCGSGILALAARKLGAEVELCDTDPLAIRSASENFALNAESFLRAWEGSAHDTGKTYDVVTANIIADVLKAIAPRLKERMSGKSILILSGILDKKEAIVTAAFGDLRLLERKSRDEWITLIYTNTKDVNG